MPVTFTKLKSGSWGLRSTSTLVTGSEVTVSRQNGSQSTEVVGSWVWSGGYPVIHIYCLATATAEAAATKSEEAKSSTPTKAQLWATAKEVHGGNNPEAVAAYRTLLLDNGYSVPTEEATTTEVSHTTLLVPGTNGTVEVTDHLNGKPSTTETTSTTAVIDGPAAMPARDTNRIAGQIISREKATGTTHDEVKLRGLDQAVRTLGKDVWQLVYDLVRVCTVTDPDGTNPRKVAQTTVPDPNAQLWCHGFPYTQSVWVMTQDQKESAGVKEMEKLWDAYPGYMEYHWTRVDARDVEAMREIARNRLAKMLQEVHSSLIARIDTAHQSWTKAQVAFDATVAAKGTVTYKERTLAEAKRCNAIRSVIRSAAEDLNNAIKRAEDFDERGGIEDLISGLRLAIRSQVNSFNAHARQVEVSGISVKV